MKKVIRLENSNDSFRNYVPCKNCGHLIKYWPLDTALAKPGWYHSSELYNPRLPDSLQRKQPLRCWAKGCSCEKPEPKDGTVVYFEGKKVYPPNI